MTNTTLLWVLVVGCLVPLAETQVPLAWPQSIDGAFETARQLAQPENWGKVLEQAQATWAEPPVELPSGPAAVPGTAPVRLAWAPAGTLPGLPPPAGGPPARGGSPGLRVLPGWSSDHGTACVVSVPVLPAGKGICKPEP